VHAVAALK